MIFNFYFGKRRANSLYIRKSVTVCTKPVDRLNCQHGWEDYHQFSLDTNICEASDLSLPCACRLFQQNHTDNHQVRLNLIKRGGTLPKLIKFRVCCLKQCWLWGNGTLLAAGTEDGDGLLGVTTKPGRPGGVRRRLKMHRAVR